MTLNELADSNDANDFKYSLEIKHNNCEIKGIKLRLPWWTDRIIINDIDCYAGTDGYVTLNNIGSEQTYTIILNRKISVIPMGGDDLRVAFMYGPVVLAGLGGDITLTETTLCEDGTSADRAWKNTEQSIKFMQLYDITDEEYSIYLNIKK